MASLSQPKYKTERTIDSIKMNNTQKSISNLIDIINDNNLSLFYDNTESNFKYNIDQLNLKFYLETEKILSPNNQKIDRMEHQNKLFLILFKQINLYIKEIERLNTIILQQAHDPQCLKKKMSIITKQKNEFETKELIIQTLKNSNNLLEKKLSYVMQSENKIREENERLKKELKLYKDKDKDITNSPLLDSMNFNGVQIANFSLANSTTNIFSTPNQNNKLLGSHNSISKFRRKPKRTYSDNNQSEQNSTNTTTNYQGSRKDIRCKGKTPNIIPHNKFNSNNKLKIIKAVKNKISSCSNARNNAQNKDCFINSINNYKRKKENSKVSSPRISSYGVKDIYHPQFCKGSEEEDEEESINELNQIENLLVEIKDHFNNNKNCDKCRSEQKMIHINLDLCEGEGGNILGTLISNCNEKVRETPHFKESFSANGA